MIRLIMKGKVISVLSIYPACFFKEKKGFSVVFPDLNWLATGGKSERDAMQKAVDCLAGYIYTLKIDGDTIPEPSPIGSISLSDVARELGESNTEGFVSIVSVDTDLYAKEHFEKAVRKTLTIPAWLNAAAMEKNINFSKTLQEALISKVRSGQ